MNIGIVARFTQSPAGDRRWYVAEEFRDLADRTGITLIPILSNKHLEKYLDMCDGLIVPGSFTDIDPKYYGQKRLPITACDDFDIYQLDWNIILPFYRAGKKVLGICAGMQSINVLFGGTLIQHITGHNVHADHSVTLTSGSWLNKYYDSDNIMVNSIHHQSVAKIADGFTVTAVSPDGCVEAIERENILAVQWHPELMGDDELFTHFFDK